MLFEQHEPLPHAAITKKKNKPWFPLRKPNAYVLWNLGPVPGALMDKIGRRRKAVKRKKDRESKRDKERGRKGGEVVAKLPLFRVPG